MFESIGLEIPATGVQLYASNGVNKAITVKPFQQKPLLDEIFSIL